MHGRATAKDPAIARALGPVRALIEPLPASSRRIVIACSGGADSVAALGLLVLLRTSLGLELALGHVDHGLRPESASEAEHVAALASRFALPIRQTRLSLARGPGLPARARAARRAALRAQADELGATTIVLAHTASDQAETMLLHMTRGAGLDGLAAMPVFDPPWLRPLLELRRADTRMLCERLGLPFVDDPSNLDDTQPRVWVRTHVLAGLRRHNGEVERSMAGLARQAREAEEALVGWAEREVEARRVAGDPTEPGRWSLSEFDELPRALRTRVLRRIAALAGADLEQLHRRTLDQLEAAAWAVAAAERRRRSEPGTPSPAPRGWDLAPKLRLTIDRNGIRVAAVGPPEPR